MVKLFDEIAETGEDGRMRDGPEFRRALEQGKAASLGHRLVRAARLFNDAALARFRARTGYGFVRPAHLSVMPHLDLDGTRLSELARRMEVSKQAAGQVVDELEASGLVTRIPDPDDGRAKRIVFTDAGRDALLTGLGVLAEVEAEILAGMRTEERRALERALDHVETRLDEAPE